MDTKTEELLRAAWALVKDIETDYDIPDGQRRCYRLLRAINAVDPSGKNWSD